jgi:hypothetical protein
MPTSNAVFLVELRSARREMRNCDAQEPQYQAIKRGPLNSWAIKCPLGAPRANTSARERRYCNGRARGNELTKLAAAVAIGVAASLSLATTAAAVCQMLQVAELDVTIQNNTPLVPVIIDGESVQMIMDTSYTRTQIRRSAAKALRLKLRPSVVAFRGPFGLDQADMTSVPDFTFAGITTHQIAFYVTAQQVTTENVVGILGEDILSPFDIEFDLASGKIRLFAPKDCKGNQVAYWTQDYFVADLTHGEITVPLIDVSLNGQKMLAAFSSGNPRSTVTIQAMRQSGIYPETAAQVAGTLQGGTTKPIYSPVVVFPTLTIGQETLHYAQLRMAGPYNRDDLARFESLLEHRAFIAPDLEIGGDFFLAHRIYLARGEKKVYFTHNAGPISQPSAPPPNPSPLDSPRGEGDRSNP